MQWTKPDFQEITLNMEVTAYVNTASEVLKAEEPPEVQSLVISQQSLVQATQPSD